RGDAIAFLHTQLRRVSNLNSLLRVWSQHGNRGKLIDQLRDSVAFNDPSLERLVTDGDVANKFAVRAANGDQADRRSHGTQDVEHGSACGIQADIVDDQVRI